jgi:hypothetical protein
MGEKERRVQIVHRNGVELEEGKERKRRGGKVSGKTAPRSRNPFEAIKQQKSKRALRLHEMSTHVAAALFWSV